MDLESIDYYIFSIKCVIHIFLLDGSTFLLLYYYLYYYIIRLLIFVQFYYCILL